MSLMRYPSTNCARNRSAILSVIHDPPSHVTARASGQARDRPLNREVVGRERYTSLPQCGLGRWRDGNPVDSRLKVREIDPTVDIRGEAGITVPQDPLGHDEADAAAREQGCGRTTQIVEAHRPRNRVRPQFHVALWAAPYIAIP